MKNSLIDEFNVHIDNKYVDKTDYEVFENKEELDILRKNILEKLGDLTYVKGEITKDIILKCMNEETLSYDLNNLERSNLYNIIDNEINGYGPLTELLSDPNIDEIMVNGPSDIFISIDGVLNKDDTVSFINDNHIIRIIKKMIKNTNINIEQEKNFTTKLEDGSILNVVLPPISVNGPILTIKKFDNFISDIDELLKLGVLTPYMARVLAASVKANLNILVCGSSLSGKTSILNALANFVDDNNRIITMENVGELTINKPNLIKLQQNDNNNELINIALKMHPDTLVIGELDNELIYPTLDIMSGRTSNVLTTYKASNVLEFINKIENIGITKYNMSSKSIRYSLLNAYDLMVVVEKTEDNKRRITSICEFNTNSEGQVVIKEIFGYKNNEFILYGYRPRIYKAIKEKQIDDLDDIFR